MTDAPPETDTPEISTHEVDLRIVAGVVGAIADGDGSLIARLTDELHPADAADVLEQLSWDQFEQALKLAPRAFAPEILAELNEDFLAEALNFLPAEQLAQAVAELDSDDATALVEELGEARRAEVLAAVPERDRQEVEAGLSFDEETAGRLMQHEFAAAPEFWTVGDAIDHLRQAGEDDLPETFFEIYVIDPKFRPLGAVPLSTLMRKHRDVRLCDIMVALRVKVSPEIDQEEAAYLFEKYHLHQAPVVDEAGRLKGMLTVDDMVEVIKEESKEDLLALAGVSEANLAQTVFEQVKARAPWLFVTLATAIGASVVISLFTDTIERVVALAVLMPIVSALGGSVGAQAVAVVVSAIAARELTPANTRRAIAREAGAAVIIGLIFAALLAGVTAFWYGGTQLPLVIGVALALTILWGGVIGILAPLALRRLGADPAVASTVFVTATTDMVGFFLFLGLATAVLL